MLVRCLLLLDAGIRGLFGFIAAGLKDMAKKDDLTITTGADRLSLYMCCFLHRNVFHIFLLRVQDGAREDMPSEIDRRINNAVSAGNDVYFNGMKPGRFVLRKEMTYGVHY